MIVYRTISFTQIIFYFFLRIGYIAVAAIALYHYNENPGVTVAIAAICILFFVVRGRDEIIVYPDTIKYKSRSIVKLFTKEKVFLIGDIESIEIQGTFSASDQITFKRMPPLNQVQLQFKNGDVYSFETSIDIDILKEAVAEIEKLITR